MYYYAFFIYSVLTSGKVPLRDADVSTFNERVLEADNVLILSSISGS